MTALGYEVPYDTIRNGGWTFDIFAGMTKDVYSDLNGDGEKDMRDRWGYLNKNGLTNNLFWGFGINVVERDERGGYVPVGTDERLVSAYQKILTFRDENPDVFNIADESWVKMRSEVNNSSPFVLGNTLFTTTGSGNLYEEIRDSEFDIGIAPYPKYEESQKTYCSICSIFPLVIPIPVENTEAVGAIIEALSAIWCRELKPVMIETYIEGKILRDQESVEVYELLLDTACIDISMYYKFSGDISPISFLSTCAADTVVSRMEAVGKAANKMASEYFNMFFDD